MKADPEKARTVSRRSFLDCEFSLLFNFVIESPTKDLLLRQEVFASKDDLEKLLAKVMCEACQSNIQS